MEITNRKLISDILTSIKADNLDDRISRRFILSKLLNRTKTLIKQDADSRRLFKVSEIWKRISCVSLKEVDIIECGWDIPHCAQMMRSCHKLPEVYQTNYGNILKVFTINMGKEFKQTSFIEYKEIARREWKNPNIQYFILLDGYIWIPDSEVEEVTVLGLFKDPFEVTKFIEGGSSCKSPLDEVPPIPDYLIDAVITSVTEELLKRTQVQQDEKPNLNENDK